MSTSDPSPDRVLQAAMAEHLAQVHDGTEFLLARDVTYDGTHPAGAIFTYAPKTPRHRAYFLCAQCPGQRFIAEEPAVPGAARNWWLRASSPQLRARLHGVPQERWDLVTADWDAGGDGRRLVREILRAETHDTGVSGRPSVDARRDAFGALLLQRVREGDTVERALDVVVALAVEDPELLHLTLGGREVPMARSTYRDYWKHLDLEVRTAARLEGAARRQERRGQRRPKKSTP